MRRNTSWPLPSSPARPTTSPLLTLTVHSFRPVLPPVAVTASRCRVWAPGSCPERMARAGSTPNIMARSSPVTKGGSMVPDTMPSLSTVISSQSASMSSSLWETRMTLLPSRASLLSPEKRRSFWRADMPVVGSSRMSTRVPEASSRTSSSCWRSPTVRRPAGTSGSRSNPRSAHRPSSLALCVRLSCVPAEACPAMKFSRTVSGGKSKGSW